MENLVIIGVIVIAIIVVLSSGKKKKVEEMTDSELYEHHEELVEKSNILFDEREKLEKEIDSERDDVDLLDLPQEEFDESMKRADKMLDIELEIARNRSEHDSCINESVRRIKKGGEYE